MAGGFKHGSAPIGGETMRASEKSGGSAGKVGGFKHGSGDMAEKVTHGNAVTDHKGANMSAAATVKRKVSAGGGFRHSPIVVTHGNPSTPCPGGDKWSYLGHFGGEKVLNDGHNFSIYGAPRADIKTRGQGAQAARQDVRFGKKLVSQAKRSGGDVEQAKGLRTMATEANQARKTGNVEARETASTMRQQKRDYVKSRTPSIGRPVKPTVAPGLRPPVTETERLPPVTRDIKSTPGFGVGMSLKKRLY